MVERTLILLPSQLQLIERLQHIIYLSSSLIFVSGDTGAGKSVLTENLSNSLPADVQQVYISLTSMPSIASMRQQIIVRLYDKPLFNSEDKLLETLSRLASKAVQTHSRNRLIIIDNAQYLPDGFILELCELFSNRSLNGNSNCNVLLLANDVNNQVHIEQIKLHISHHAQALLKQVELRVAQLSPQEARALLLHNFQQADYRPKLQHQDALNAQLRSCGGNPQKIIQLADDLSQGLIVPEVNSWVKTRLPALLLMFTLVAVVSAIGVYLYPRFIPAQSVEKTLEQDDRASHIELREESKTETTGKTASDISPDLLASTWQVNNSEIDNYVSAVGVSDETVQEVMLSGDQLIELSVLAETEKEQDLTVVTHSDAAPLLQIQQQSYDGIVLPSVNERHEENVVQKIQQESSTLATIDVIVEPTPIEEVLIPTAVVAVEKLNFDASNLFTDSDILLSKPVTHYTLQLSALSSQVSLELFGDKYNLPQTNVFVYQTVTHSKQRFVVIYGDYDSLASAQLAAESLPAPFKSMPTWIRQWQAVHNDLRLNDE